MTLDETRDKLRAMRRSLEGPFAVAQAADDTAEMERLQGIAGDIDDLLDNLALIGLGNLAASLTEIRTRIDGHAANAVAAGQGFAGATLSEIRAAIREIFDQSAEEELPEELPVEAAPVIPAGMPAAPPAPIGADAAPDAPAAISPVAPIAAPLIAVLPQLDAPVAVAAPAEDGSGRLLLSEAHLLALWKRSLFPVDPTRITVFGLRGCRPVVFSGTGLAPSHEITMAQVDYRTMNCALGHWHPGKGLAVFPGSTVPFGTTVAGRIDQNGVGVNQMGRGRYKRYVAGWHKRSEGRNGHWALRQECAITLQRTGDDADFDLSDRWEVGRIAGDNIHCAFHMGVDGNIPDARFSSAGCQTIAGTVIKGDHDSAQGPYRAFIAPFDERALGNQKETEYVLFAAEEAQMMIRTRCAGRSVILRFGSQGPLVAGLQKALNRVEGSGIRVDGDFGPATFQAVIDYQTRVFGPDADDGIVGAGTAAKLGFTLPDFDFDDAISGGPGHDGATEMAVPAPAAGIAGLPPQPIMPGMEMAFGALTRAKHGQAFNDKVIAISQRLQCDPNHLMAVMAFESGESFAPDKKNAAGSGATGLIQFMPATARGLGTTTAKLAAMSAIEQLDFVEKHFKSVVGNRPMPALSDVYMAVLLPVAVGKLDSHVLFEKPSKAYDQNAGLDKNRNGRITKAEAAGKVQDKLVLGMKTGRFG